MVLLTLDTKSTAPKFQQIIDQIISLIDSGVLKNGMKLPSSRELADRLEVNRSTVYRAYQELWSLGYVTSRPGSYSIVRRRNEVVTRADETKPSAIPWEQTVTAPVRNLSDSIGKHRIEKAPADTIDFTSISPEPDDQAVQQFKSCLNRVIRDDGVPLLQYGDVSGYLPLQEVISEQMKLHCMEVSPDQIIITNGAQNALWLAFQLLLKSGTRIITENPTYPMTIPLAGYLGGEITGIPMRQEGMDLDLMEEAIRREFCSLVYTMPNFQNPTGITTTQGHRERLLNICEKYKIPLIEDGFVEEMKYFGRTVLPIKSMDQRGTVIYIGTFSKVLFPGLRIGWIAASRECIRTMNAIKNISEISTNSLNQAALALFCEYGYYDHHLKRLHRIYRRRMQCAMKACRDFFPANGVSYTKPPGGYTFWVSVDTGAGPEQELIERIKAQGVSVAAGRLFQVNSDGAAGFRLSIAQRSEREIEEGIRRIGQVLQS